MKTLDVILFKQHKHNVLTNNINILSLTFVLLVIIVKNIILTFY